MSDHEAAALVASRCIYCKALVVKITDDPKRSHAYWTHWSEHEGKGSLGTRCGLWAAGNPAKSWDLNEQAEPNSDD